MERIIVTLTEARSNKDLAKTIKEEQMSGNFNSLFLYMLKEDADDLNPRYDSDKLITLNSLKEAYDMNEQKGQMKLNYISSKDNNPHKVQLTEIVRDQDGILHGGDEVFGDISAEYKRIELICSYNADGGY